MSADALITRDGPVAVPMDYTVPGASEAQPLVVTASFNGASAGGSFVPTLEVIAPTGAVVARCPLDTSIAAGGSADVSWFPWWRGIGAQAPEPSPTGKLWAWYDFSDASTITLDGSGKISAILDKSGLGHHLYQTTPAQRPSQSTLNALACGLFTSAAKTVLVIPAVTDPLPQPYVIFVVYTQSVAASSGYFPGPIGGTSSPTPNPNLFVNDSNSLIVMQQGLSSITRGSAPIAPFLQRQMTLVFNGASSRFRITGTETDGTVAVDPVTTVVLGAQQYPYIDTNDGLDGKIGEVLYYYGPLSNAQIAGVESYLAAKWATPG